MIEAIIPVLPVKHLGNSITFYTDILGFKVEWRGELVASVSRYGHQLMLSEMHGEKKPTWVWIGLENADWFEELLQKDVTVHQTPLNQTYAYEMMIEDIDGNILWLGTAPRSDMPVQS